MKFKLSFSILFVTSIITAQNNFDTLLTKQVADGVVHYHVVENSVPWNLNVLRIDLTNPQISVTSAKAFDKVEGGLETTSSMAARQSNDSVTAIGTINGDFFGGTGRTTGLQVLNGEIVSTLIDRNWSKIGFDINKNPLIERMQFTGELITKNATTTLHGINKTRSTNQLILFNKYFGSSTGTNEFGTELILQPLEKPFVNDTTKFIVIDKEENIGNAEINDHVLSGHGTSRDFLNANTSIGDTIQIITSLTNGFDKIETLVSGFPQIVKDGTNYAVTGYYEEGGSATFHTDRHPRTGIGFNSDSSYLYFVVVDGRQSISRGMSLIELADFMIEIGVHTGLNLDGGGSSTFVVKDKIYNSPSDGIERNIGNALVVLTSESQDIAGVDLFPDSVVTNLEREIQFELSATDNYGFNIELEIGNVTFQLSNTSVGAINNQLLFSPNEVGTTYVIAEIGGVKDTSTISVENYTGLTQLTSFEEQGNWFVTGLNVDTVNSTIDIVDSEFSEGGKSLAANYNFTYQSGQSNWIYINNSIPIYGVPLSISIDAKSDGRPHSIAYVVADENGEEFAVLNDKNAINTESFETLTGNFENPIELNSNSKFYFPIKLKQIAINLGSERENGVEYSGTIYLDNLRISYDESTAIKDDKVIPIDFALEQNFPNPFNPTTKIKFALTPSLSQWERVSEGRVRVFLKVYNILGREIATLIDETKSPGVYEVEFNVGTAHELSLPSGVYFYRLTIGNKSIAKKMMLIK